MGLPLQEIKRGAADQKLRDGDPIAVGMFRPHSQIGDGDFGNVQLQIHRIFEGKLIGRLNVDGARIDLKGDPILDLFPYCVRLQPDQSKFAVRFDRLRRQVTVPLDSFTELGHAGECKLPAVDARGEIPQLEIDGLQPRREIGGTAAIFVGQKSVADFERADSNRGQRLILLLRFGRRRNLRFQLQ